MHHGLFLITLLSAALLAACGTAPAGDPDAPAVPGGEGVAAQQVDLLVESRPPQAMAQLEVGIVVFDPGIPTDPASHAALGIYPEIRKAEARYLPFLLREALVASNGWGAVRVLPEPDDSMPLLVTGTILRSDGLALSLHIRASDSSGHLWLDRVYSDIALEQDYVPETAAGRDPYQDLYHRIANDLQRLRRGMSAADLERVRQVASLRYASDLAPDAFAGYMSQSPEGGVQLRRLPAADDPMLARIGRVREKQYLFIDTLDEQYAALYDTMQPGYLLWRQYGREIAVYREEYLERQQERDREGRRGSFAAMQQAYNAYKWSKIQQQDMDELAQGFNNEVAPTVMEVQGQVYRLSGSLAEQYAQWQRILRQVFLLETGLPATP
jgi:hypothetical protein